MTFVLAGRWWGGDARGTPGVRWRVVGALHHGERVVRQQSMTTIGPLTSFEKPAPASWSCATSDSLSNYLVRSQLCKESRSWIYMHTLHSILNSYAASDCAPAAPLPPYPDPDILSSPSSPPQSPPINTLPLEVGRPEGQWTNKHPIKRFLRPWREASTP